MEYFKQGLSDNDLTLNNKNYIELINEYIDNSHYDIMDNLDNINTYEQVVEEMKQELIN